MSISMEMITLIMLVTGGLSALAYMIGQQHWLRRQVVREKPIQLIADEIKKGVYSFIKRQYSVAFEIIGVFFILLVWMAYNDFITWYTPFAVLSGAGFSALAAYLGLLAAVKANAATAHATKKGLAESVKTAINGGAIMGFSVCSFGMLDLAFWYSLIYFQNPNISVYEFNEILVSTIITFAFGASFMAYMARVAGGIFTKSADSAADSVGKGEYGWEEDDPRNPATIADNVGDNVNDIQAMGQDLNESYVAGNAAAMEAGFYSFNTQSAVFGVSLGVSILVGLPLAVSVIGIFASIIGLTVLKAKSNDLKSLLNAFRAGVYLTSVLIAIVSAPLVYYLFGDLNRWYTIVIGLITGNVLASISEYYTSTAYSPVRRLANKAEGGHASVVVAGESLGRESVLFTTLALCLGMLAAFYVSGGGNFAEGIYGVSLAAVSMLATLPITLTIDAFGPIADNAQGLLEMSQIDGERLKIGNTLDALGNTTAATGKGYAIGSAAFAAIALLNALWHSIERSVIQFNLPAIALGYDKVIWIMAGLLLGIAVPWMFSSYLLKAVGNTAFVLIQEIKRQVKELGILTGLNPPDTERCVSISLKAAQRYSIVPALLVILIPFIVAVVGGPLTLIAFLTGSLFSAFTQAVYMNNAGGAWDNAKKLIEAGYLGGKHTDAHRAAITGDMVGDPYKDTAGPALNILIKLMVTFSILMAPLTIYLHSVLF